MVHPTYTPWVYTPYIHLSLPPLVGVPASRPPVFDTGLLVVAVLYRVRMCTFSRRVDRERPLLAGPLGKSLS